jgi:hypothetical protein
MKCDTTGESRDIFSSPWLTFVFFVVPAIAIAVTGGSEFDIGSRTVVWTGALGIMGTACIANAVRCGRLHCYITGPFFLALASVTLLYGLGVVPLGSRGWSVISLIILVGAIALCCLPEMIFGKYRRGSAPE